MLEYLLFFVRRAMTLVLLAGLLVVAVGCWSPASATPVHTAPVSSIAATNNAAKGSVTQQATSRLKTSWTWYVARGSGFAAAILLLLLMLSGIGLVTGFTYRFMEPLMAWTVHRAMGIALLASVALHMGVLLFDKFVPFDLADLFVPFISQNSKFASPTAWRVAIGLGVLAFYATVLVVVTSLLFINKRARMWRLVHFLSYGLLVAVFVHGFFVGTDLKKGWVRVAWIIVGVVMLLAFLTRLYRARTISGGRHQ